MRGSYLLAGDTGTYFCEKYNKRAAHANFAFKSPDTGEESAVSMALIWKKLLGNRQIDFVFHLDSK